MVSLPYSSSPHLFFQINIGLLSLTFMLGIGLVGALCLHCFVQRISPSSQHLAHTFDWLVRQSMPVR